MKYQSFVVGPGTRVLSWDPGPLSFVVGPGTPSFVVGPGTQDPLSFFVGPGTRVFLWDPGPGPGPWDPWVPGQDRGTHGSRAGPKGFLE